MTVFEVKLQKSPKMEKIILTSKDSQCQSPNKNSLIGRLLRKYADNVSQYRGRPSFNTSHMKNLSQLETRELDVSWKPRSRVEFITGYTLCANYYENGMRIFGSFEYQTESTFPFLYIIIFQRWQSFEPPNSTPREIDKCAHSLFCTEFNAEQLLFEVFPHIWTTHLLGALVSGIMNEVSCASLYHDTNKEKTPVSYESKF